jgi:lipopolysaccharide/colanic/teichoic acid biosynthesis glycosyltransferase
MGGRSKMMVKRLIKISQKFISVILISIILIGHALALYGEFGGQYT